MRFLKIGEFYIIYISDSLAKWGDPVTLNPNIRLRNSRAFLSLWPLQTLFTAMVQLTVSPSGWWPERDLNSWLRRTVPVV